MAENSLKSILNTQFETNKKCGSGLTPPFAEIFTLFLTLPLVKEERLLG